MIQDETVSLCQAADAHRYVENLWLSETGRGGGMGVMLMLEDFWSLVREPYKHCWT
jgi:hypothetical protein